MPEGIKRSRETRQDLEKGQEHLTEMYERIAPLLKMDAVKNEEALLITEDLKKITEALRVKDEYAELRQKLEAVVMEGIQKLRRKDDREEIHQLLQRMADYPSDARE